MVIELSTLNLNILMPVKTEIFSSKFFKCNLMHFIGNLRRNLWNFFT